MVAASTVAAMLTALGSVAAPPALALGDAGAQAAPDPVTSHYGQLGGTGSVLGAPTDPVHQVVGREVQDYAGGSITWSPATGAHEVHGAIGTHYQALGGPEGVLGFPVTDETATPDGMGRFDHFANGASIYWTPATGAWSIRGAIRGHWAAMGWERSAVGYPVTDETGAPDGLDRYNQFANGGSIYWTPQTGAWSVHGRIRDRWASMGWERSSVGYPTSDEYGIPFGRQSNFQYGAISWDAASGATRLNIGCPGNDAGHFGADPNTMANDGGGNQLITVSDPYGSALAGTLTAWDRLPSGCWVPHAFPGQPAQPYRAERGYGGIKPIGARGSGDGSTPQGVFGFGPTMYGVSGSSPNPAYGYRPLTCGSWWDEAPGSATYDSFQQYPCGVTPPFAWSAEALWTETVAYVHFADILTPNPPQNSAGIFLHDDTTAGDTAGCVALPPGELDAVLGWMKPGALPHIIIGTAAVMNSL